MKSSNNTMRNNRRETRSQYNDSNNNRDNSRNNNQQQMSGAQFDKRKQNQQTSPQKPNNQQQQASHQANPQPTHYQQQQQHRPQDYRDRSGQRDHGGQRERSGQRVGQYQDGNMGGAASNLGSVKFTPSFPTRELPPIETRADPSKKFTGRCRLFVGNLPHNTVDEQVKKLFEPFGEIGEVFLGPKSSFAFVKMDTRQNAEAARDALDCSTFDGRTLRVRLAAHAAAIRVKHLSPVVTNELLAYAFRYFGEIERAVVVVDDKGKSVGEGIVEYSKKQSALFAVKRCQQECFMLTASPMPVLVEPYDQHDEDEGLPEKSVNKNSVEYKEQRDVGPRFAEQGSFEHAFALRWKELYGIEKQKHDRLQQEIEEARKNLQSQIEYSRIEHDTMQLKSKLQQLEDNRLKLQQMKDQHLNETQQREEMRRQQDLMLRQREEDILRRQQMGDPTYLTQQDQVMRSQGHVLQDMLAGGAGGMSDVSGGDFLQQTDQQTLQASAMAQESDASMSFGSMMGQNPRTFADVAMMGMNQSYLQSQQLAQQMTMAPPSQTSQAMFTGYIPPPPLQSSLNDGGNSTYSSYQQQTHTDPSASQPETGQVARQPKMTRSYVNHANNINVTQNRPRKRTRY